MPVHRRVTPQQYVAGIDLGDEKQSGVEVLLWGNNVTDEAWISNSRSGVWGVLVCVWQSKTALPHTTPLLSVELIRQFCIFELFSFSDYYLPVLARMLVSSTNRKPCCKSIISPLRLSWRLPIKTSSWHISLKEKWRTLHQFSSTRVPLLFFPIQSTFD